MAWTVKQELCVYDDRRYAVATAETPELAARLVAMAEALEKARAVIAYQRKDIFGTATVEDIRFWQGDDLAKEVAALDAALAAIDGTR